MSMDGNMVVRSLFRAHMRHWNRWSKLLMARDRNAAHNELPNVAAQASQLVFVLHEMHHGIDNWVRHTCMVSIYGVPRNGSFLINNGYQLGCLTIYGQSRMSLHGLFSPRLGVQGAVSNDTGLMTANTFFRWAEQLLVLLSNHEWLIPLFNHG